MALGFVRSLVSGQRKRLVDEESGVDLDLTYITSRIVAMGYPSTGLEAAYRNSAADVAKFLDSRHAGTYMLLNLSERPYDESTFEHRVMNVGFPDHHPPPFDLLWTIVISLDRWLQADLKNIVVVHCQAGKGRTGTVIAAAMLLRQWWSLAKAGTVLARELAEGVDPMAGALHEDKGTVGRASILQAADDPLLWQGGIVPTSTTAMKSSSGVSSGAGTTAHMFCGPSWCVDAAGIAHVAGSGTLGDGSSCLVMRPPSLMARAALRLFWARRGEGVTYGGQARSVVLVAAWVWLGIAKSIYRLEGLKSKANTGATDTETGATDTETAATDTETAATDTETAATDTETVFPSKSPVDPMCVDEEIGFKAWLLHIRKACRAGGDADGRIIAMPHHHHHHSSSDSGHAAAGASTGTRHPHTAASLSASSFTSGGRRKAVEVGGPCGVSLQEELYRFPLLRVANASDAAWISEDAVLSLRRFVPPEPVPMALTSVRMPIPPTLPLSLGHPSERLCRLSLVIEQTPFETAKGRIFYSSAWMGPEACPVVTVGEAAVVTAASATAGLLHSGTNTPEVRSPWHNQEGEADREATKEDKPVTAASAASASTRDTPSLTTTASASTRDTPSLTTTASASATSVLSGSDRIARFDLRPRAKTTTTTSSALKQLPEGFGQGRHDIIFDLTPAASGRSTSLAASNSSHQGVVVSGDVTLRLLATPTGSVTGALLGRATEVWRTTLHSDTVMTGLEAVALQAEPVPDESGVDWGMVVRTVRGLDMDHRKERLRGLSLRAAPGTGSWLSRRYRVEVRLARATPEEAAAEKQRAIYRAEGRAARGRLPHEGRAASESAAGASAAASAALSTPSAARDSEARALSEDARAHSLCREGWVWKRGDVNTAWKRRWLVLRHRTLHYYRDPAGAPAGSVPLSECIGVDTLRPVEAGGRSHVFVVRTPGRVWRLQAETEEDQAEWLSVVGQAWASLLVPLASRDRGRPS